MYRRQQSRPFPRKKMQKGKMVISEEALQIAEKRREAKGKGEKERYPFEFSIPKKSKKRKERFPQ